MSEPTIAPTNVIFCWQQIADPVLDPPDDLIGPLTHEQALRVAATLTCHWKIKTMRHRTVEWMTDLR